MIASAVLSNFAVTNSYFLPTSMQLASLGNDKFLGIKKLTYLHPKYQMPWVAIVINSIICGICVVVPFTLLVEVTNVFYSLLIICMCLCVVVLRYSKEGKKLHRPFKVVKSNLGTILIASGPIIVSLFILGTSLSNGWIPVVLALASFASFFVIYLILKCYKRRKVKLEEMEALIN